MKNTLTLMRVFFSCLLLGIIFHLYVSGQKPEPIKTVKIGDQVWMAANLDVTKFRNGDDISDVPNAESWKISGSYGIPSYAAYENNPEYRKKWGLLYNYFAISDPRGLCPDGWRVPNNKDWNDLETFLGKGTASLKLKSDNGWINNGNGTDQVDFNGLPGGFRTQRGDFFLGLRVGYWWSETQDSKREVTSILLFDYDDKIFRIQYAKEMGQSVRCIR